MGHESSNLLLIKDLSKSQKALLYILQKTDGGFGHIKMMKTILRADQVLFRIHFRSFSGYTYIKKTHGPYSEMFKTDREILVEESFIEAKPERVEHPKFTYKVKFRDDSWYDYAFSGEELETLDSAIAEIEPMESLEASEDTHDWVYDSIEDGGEIPLFMYLEPATLTEAHKAEAIRLFHAG